MAQVSVNIDHVATVRQARRTWEPCPVQAAAEAIAGGCAGITVHLREDRRHIQDGDVHTLRETVAVPLHLEMAATDEMVEIARNVQPRTAMLVPEGRMEVTTEGGLDVAGQQDRLTDVVSRLREAGIPVSAFIDPQLQQVEAAAACGFAVCEVHTGPWAHAYHADPASAAAETCLQNVTTTGAAIVAAGMQFNAGHALNYDNVTPIAALPNLGELHIGHAIISRSVFTGIRDAVATMVNLVKEAST